MYYYAPEVLGGSYNEKYDIWSIGVNAYNFLVGKYPFDDYPDHDDDKIENKIIEGIIDYKSN